MSAKPPTRQFSSLERTLLDWFAVHQESPQIAVQLAGARILRREYNVVGLNVWLIPEADADPAPNAGERMLMRGPDILSEGIEHGGGSNLWINEEGFVECLELWAHGGYFAETISRFEICEAVAR